MHTTKKEDYLNCKQVFEFKNNDIEIYIPNNSLYKDYLFSYTKSKTPKNKYDTYKILDKSTPIHKPFIISITADSVEKNLRSKALIGRIEDDKISCIKSKWEENKIVGKSKNFGDFRIVIDTVKPEIKYYSKTKEMIKFKIQDKLSGIKKYRGTINEKWVLMEYDFKTNLLTYQLDTTKNEKNQVIKIEVIDQVDNKNEINFDLSK